MIKEWEAELKTNQEIFECSKEYYVDLCQVTVIKNQRFDEKNLEVNVQPEKESQTRDEWIEFLQEMEAQVQLHEASYEKVEAHLALPISANTSRANSSFEEPPQLELKPLPEFLKYAF